MLSFLFEPFLTRALLAGFGLVAAAGPLGCFVVWRRMAYFGDAAAHAAILGVALALATEIPIFAGVLLLAFAMAIAASATKERHFGADTVLGVASHGALAVGMVSLAFMPSVRIDLMGYLFGDILSVSTDDLWLIWGGAAIVLAILVWRWNALLTVTLGAELAAAEGFNPSREKLIMTVALSIMVAVAIKVVGALLITAMLIVPAAAARSFSRTPEVMAVGATAVGLLSVIFGLWLSWTYDTPAGPSIVATAVGFFLAGHCANKAATSLRHNRER